MGTKQQTDSSNQSNLQYDPGSLSTYKGLTSTGGGVLQDYMKNPLHNAFFNLSQAMGQKGAAQGGQNNMQALLQMMKTSGIGGTAGQGFQGAQQAQMGRANQSMMSQANMSGIQQALARQMGATGMGMSFSPLLTGQSGKSSQTQTTGGLGTWLPQLMGGIAGGAMGMATGGLSGMGMNAAGTAPAFSGGIGSLSSTMNLPSNAFQGINPIMLQGLGGSMPSFGG